MNALSLFGFNPQVLSAGILAVSYVILFSEKVNRAVVAILGASVMIFSGVLAQSDAFRGIDFNTLALLIGMMTIVGISEKSGMFQYVAIWSAKKVKASPRGVLIMLALVTAFFSAFLDNVTTVLLIVPVSLLVTEKLKVSPYPFLYAEIAASNIGGTATLIGDPPNIMIGSMVGLSFNDFLVNLAPVCIVIMLVMVLGFDFVVGRKLKASAEDRAKVMLLM